MVAIGSECRTGKFLSSGSPQTIGLRCKSTPPLYDCYSTSRSMLNHLSIITDTCQLSTITKHASNSTGTAHCLEGNDTTATS